MKKIFLILTILVFGKEGVFAKCPSCPEKTIKREATSVKPGRKKATKVSTSAERLQKKTERAKPPVSSAKAPFPSPASFILKKESKLVLPDGTVLRLIRPEDLKRVSDLP
ncbi:MAG: hypothetical protein AB1630_01040 [bacterium]